MLNTMWTLIQTYPNMHIIDTYAIYYTRTCASRMAHPLRQMTSNDITNLPPGGNPIGTPTVKVD